LKLKILIEMEKKFDKVSRIYCRSESYEMDLVLDINSEIYPLDFNTKFTLVLARYLTNDGNPDEGSFDPIAFEKKTMLRDYEYVMYGKIFKYQQEKSPSLKATIYASFGGLLMMLKGDRRTLAKLEQDLRVYLLIRKVYI